jgi:hypothetical protein
MATQISTIRITWAVLTDLVLVRRDARSEPRSSSALGATPLDGQDVSVTAVAPMPSPIEPRPMARFVHAATLGRMPRCASLASTCLSISELILSTSPSATAPSYTWPSSVCTAAAAATSSRARTSIQPSYIAIEYLTTCYVAATHFLRTPTEINSTPPHPVVLLIDEVDRLDVETEALLLEGIGARTPRSQGLHDCSRSSSTAGLLLILSV